MEFEGHGQHLRLYEVPLTSQLDVVEVFWFESEQHHIILETLRFVPIATMSDLQQCWGNALALKQAQLITMHSWDYQTKVAQ